MLAAAGGWALICSAVHDTAARSDVMLTTVITRERLSEGAPILSSHRSEFDPSTLTVTFSQGHTQAQWNITCEDLTFQAFRAFSEPLPILDP